MKKLLILASLFLTHSALASTCTSISRSNVAANAVLTSTEYNGSLNSAFNAINAADGGCLNTGSLEYDALNTTSFNAVLNGVHEGCNPTNSDSNTISVDRCMLAVNGQFVRTTTATTVTWGCSGCGSEAASTEFYVFAATGSAGSTLTLKILTGAPNNDGYDASGNKVIARFFNNSSSNIDGVEPWKDGRFVHSRSMVRLQVGAGHGATNTNIRIFSSVVSNFGPDITYATSAASGNSFTINTSGVYSFSYVDAQAAGSSVIGISLNSNQLTTSIGSITAANILASITTVSAQPSFVGWTGFLTTGDVVRAHTDAGPDATTAARSSFTAVKISP